MKIALSLLAAFAVPASAQSSFVPQLAPGEVVLEIEAEGVAREIAASAIATVNLRATAPSQIEAEAALERKISDTRQVATRYGSTDVQVNRTVTQMLIPGFREIPVAPGTNPRPQQRSAGATVGITYSDVRRSRELQSELQRLESGFTVQPRLAPGQSASARQAAKQDALAKAQADAEAYASRLGLRVRRLVRISERGTLDISDVANLIASGPPGRQQPSRDGTVETRVGVTVDYILGPR